MSPTALATPTMTGSQKVAVLLMQMPQDVAAQVMQNFTDDETQEIAADLVRMRSVAPDVAEKVINEFYDLAASGSYLPRGGREYAVGLLEASFGAERAAGLMDRLASTMAGKSFEFLEDTDAGQILSLMEGEHPNTVALVLAHLGPVVAAHVLAGMEGEARTDVAEAVARMGTPSQEAVTIVSEALKSRMGASLTPKQRVEVVGGVQPLVDIINRSDSVVERSVLDGITERDPELAEEIRSRMLTFADIVKFDPIAVQTILRTVDIATLALAMKGVADTVIDTVLRNMSDRNRSLLEEEQSTVGMVRKSQVEEARSDIVRTIRTLESDEKITISRDVEDEIVS